MEENTKQTPQPETAPATRSSSAKSSNSKMLWIIGGISALVVVICLVAFAILVATGTLKLFGGGASGFKTIDVSNPEAAVAKLNSQLIESLRSIDLKNTTNPFGDASTFLRPFVDEANLEDFRSAELILDFDFASEDQGDAKFSFNGSIQKQADNKVALEGRVTVEANDVTNAGDLSADFDFVVVDETIYIKLNDIDSTDPATQETLAFMVFIQDKWLKFSPDEAQDFTQSFSASLNSEDEEMAEQLEELLELWQENPPFENGKVANGREISGTATECMTMGINPVAFNAYDVLATNYPDIEICTGKGGTAPMFVGFEMEEEESTGTFGLTLTSYNGEVNIVAPEGAVDLNELFGSLQ